MLQYNICWLRPLEKHWHTGGFRLSVLSLSRSTAWCHFRTVQFCSATTHVSSTYSVTRTQDTLEEVTSHNRQRIRKHAISMELCVYVTNSVAKNQYNQQHSSTLRQSCATRRSTQWTSTSAVEVILAMWNPKA